MMRATRVLLGIGSLLPVFVIPTSFALTWILAEPGAGEIAATLTIVVPGFMVLSLLVFCAVQWFYIVHAYRNERATEQRWLWIAFLLCAQIIAVPAYWHRKIRAGSRE